MWRVPGLHLQVESDRGTAIFTPLFLNRRGTPAVPACTAAAGRCCPNSPSLGRLCRPSASSHTCQRRPRLLPCAVSACAVGPLVQQLRPQYHIAVQ